VQLIQDGVNEFTVSYDDIDGHLEVWHPASSVKDRYYSSTDAVRRLQTEAHCSSRSSLAKRCRTAAPESASVSLLPGGIEQHNQNVKCRNQARLVA